MQSPVITLVARTVFGHARRRPWPIFALIALCWCIASPAAAQSALTGIVHDPSGRVAVGATVTVFDATATHQWETHASAIGYYEIELPPGEYRIQANLDQLTFSGTVHVFPNEKTALDIELQFRSQDRVTVKSDAAPGATAGSPTALGATFSRASIETLPLTNGRTLQSLLSLVPGIVVTDSVGTLAQFTAVGQRRFSNRLTIDGVSADLAVDTRNLGISEGGSGSLPAVSTLGGTQTIVPIAAIEEIQVKTTDASAQDARTPGAQTMVVTRAGSNRFKGEAFTDLRPEQLGAADWFATSTSPVSSTVKGPASSQVGGASAGGPLMPQRVFYFAAWERQRVNRPVSATIQVPSLESREIASGNVKPLLNAFPIPNGSELPGGLAELSGDFPAVSNLSTLSLRADASLSPRHSLFARINIGDSRGDWLDTFQLPTTSFSYLEGATAKTATVGLTSAYSQVTNELRVNASVNRGSSMAGPSSRVSTEGLPLDLLLPSDSSEAATLSKANTWVGVSVAAFNGFVASGHAVGNTQEQVQLADTLSISRRRHDWRFGIDGRWQTVAIDPARMLYSYRFKDISDLLQGRVRLLTIQELIPVRTRFIRISAFAEDAIRVSPHFSLRYGLRYSVEPAPSSRTDTQPLLLDISLLPEVKTLQTGTRLWNTPWVNIAPHFAATYQFGTNTGHETTVRASFNRVFDELTSANGGLFGAGYPYLTARLLSSPMFPIPTGLLTAQAAAPFTQGDRNAYYAFPRDPRTPRTYTWQFGVDQTLGGVQRLSLAYAGAAGRDLSYWYTYHIGTPVPLARVNAFSNDGRSDYHALLAEYVWRLSRGLQAQVSYSWSHTIDIDSGEMTLLSQNPPPSLISPLSNRASADFDRRHVLQAVASYQLPRLSGPSLFRRLTTDWQIDTTVAVRSGAPVTVTATRDIGFGTFDFRPDAVPGIPIWIPDQTAPGGQRIDPEAFAAPTELRQGTLGRNTLQASPLRQLDLGLSRSIRLGDRIVARIRLDAFNVFNIANFGPPVGELLDTPRFGRPSQSYANALGTGTLTGGGLVPIQQLGGPRSVQVGVRVSF